MSYLLDTDICSAHTRNERLLFARFMQHVGQLFVSTITVGELQTWANRLNASARRKRVIEQLLSDVTILEVDEEVATVFGTLRASMLDRGQNIPTADGFIAATALHHNLTLVTHNMRDYTAVGGLKLIDWLTP